MLEQPGELWPRSAMSATMANSFSRFNSSLAAVRRENNDGVYDIHTNILQWPKTMQPTHARWTSVEQERADGQGDEKMKDANGINADQHDTDQQSSSIFKELDPVYPRNFMIHDLVLEGAPESRFGPPGLDNDPQSLSSLSCDVLDELSADCRQAFEEAKARELSWRSRWSTESTDGARGRFMPTVQWFP